MDFDSKIEQLKRPGKSIAHTMRPPRSLAKSKLRHVLPFEGTHEDFEEKRKQRIEDLHTGATAQQLARFAELSKKGLSSLQIKRIANIVESLHTDVENGIIHNTDIPERITRYLQMLMKDVRGKRFKISRRLDSS
jgi:hypothetical protein